MKISVFTCFSVDTLTGGFVFTRTKITVDTLTKDVTFYPFKGSEHTVCNHAEQAVSERDRKSIRKCCFI